MQPTNIEFQYIFNPSEGVIYTLSSARTHEALSFEGSRKEPMRAWSDPAFLECRQQASATTPDKTKDLKYIIQVRCDDQLTQALVNRIMSSGQEGQRHYPPAGSHPPNQKSLFQVAGTDRGGRRRNGVALMSTPPGMRVVMLLGQRREGLGMKRVKSIQIVKDDFMQSQKDDTSYLGPTLIFALEDVDAEQEEGAQRVAASATYKGKGKDREGPPPKKHRPNPSDQSGNAGSGGVAASG